ncbi:MAG: bacterial Ig-like domain-containing protein [Clostridia bacterium]|nr:bacterial Ig-like domain-containing protein [Clostridia bacterium]
MKKGFSLLIALVLVLAFALPVLASCETEKTVKSISVVNSKTEYKVGETIDYDNLQIEITYEDDSTQTKTVKELKATVLKADLSKAGNTSYTITYSGKSTTVNITVTDEQVDDVKNFQARTFVQPAFYTNYKIKSADRGNTNETRADFRITGETYEVGNVNKFIFRPTATGLDLEQLKTVTLQNVKTTVKVYSKDTKDGTYSEVAADKLADFVTIEDNTYLFSEQAAGKYVKLEISLDEEEYDVEGIDEENRTITVELVVVDGGYNVYDQLGLSVMSDIGRNVWADLWGCQSVWNAEKATYELTSKDGVTPVKLEADDQPLYTYVDNISWVILHNNIVLNADQLPSAFFWNSENDQGYVAARDSLGELSQMKAKLIGSLKDGLNNDTYYRIIDLVPNSEVAADLNLVPNMQKAFFLTKKVSVSGNYNSITVPEEQSENGRNFFTIVDHDDSTAATDPVTHYSIFQMYRANTSEGENTYFEIKNIALSGNSAKQDIDDTTIQNGVPSGMMMSLNYAKHMKYNNVVGDKFFTNILVDGYGETGIDIINTKLYDSYSNMTYMWRSTVNIENSEMIGSGGPLFILCDGDDHFVNTGLTDANGSNLTVDDKSVLQAYATGGESWYKINNAQILVNSLIPTLESVLGNPLLGINKTILTKQNNLDYVNIIAVIICSPSQLLTGKNEGMMDVCGSFTTVSETESIAFEMHNNYLVALRANAQNNATQFPVILQLGNNFAFSDGTALYTLGATGPVPFNPATDGVAWATDTHDKIAVYMSAGPSGGGANAPYFAAIMEINAKA